MDPTTQKIYKWLQHPKDSNPRTKDELLRYEDFWNDMKKSILDLKGKPDKEEVEKDFIKYVMFTGTIYRYHEKFKNSFPFGIDFDGLNHSWTKQTDPNKMYILHPDTEYLRITRTLTPDDFGIDIIGYQDCGNKHGENIDFGSPAIQREKEIVFPLKNDGKNRFDIIKF